MIRPLLRPAVLALAVGAGPALSNPSERLPFGVFDPAGLFAEHAEVRIEHVFLPWEDVSVDSLVAADDYALARDRALLVTVEPWTWSRDERNSPEALRQGLLSGAYDANMTGLCQVLGTLESPVTVRWAHEMENANGRFIWAGWEPEDYVAAFRRIASLCRAAAPRVNVMWSPLGFEELALYYPGDEWVDLVGVSIFGYQAYEERAAGRPLTYQELLDERYARAAVFGKPVVVAELGYTGCEPYVQSWDDAVRRPQPDMPLLSGVVYFNQREVHPWPDGFGQPDWRVDSRVTEGEGEGRCGVPADAPAAAGTPQPN